MQVDFRPPVFANDFKDKLEFMTIDETVSSNLPLLQFKNPLFNLPPKKGEYLVMFHSGKISLQYWNGEHWNLEANHNEDGSLNPDYLIDGWLDFQEHFFQLTELLTRARSTQ